MTIEPQTLIAIAVPLVIGLGWLFRLEARVTRADERHNDLKSDISEIKSDLRKIRAFMGGGVDRT
jgi:hypothetical protein